MKYDSLDHYQAVHLRMGELLKKYKVEATEVCKRVVEGFSVEITSLNEAAAKMGLTGEELMNKIRKEAQQ